MNSHGSFDDAPEPSHATLNKDEATSARGAQKNMAGVTYFQLSEDVATRATKKAWDSVWNELPEDMRRQMTEQP